MKKLLALTFGLIIAGYSSASLAQAEKANNCTFPDSPGRHAPSWVCNVMPEGVALGSVGYARNSVAGLSFMRRTASHNARVDLASKLSANSNTVTLVNTRVLASARSPAGGLYMLVGMDQAAYNQNQIRVSKS